MRVPPVAWVTWALVFVVLEAIALLDGTPNDTLTETIHSVVPAALVAGGIAWLAWHFWRTYHAKGGK